MTAQGTPPTLLVALDVLGGLPRVAVVLLAFPADEVLPLRKWATQPDDSLDLEVVVWVIKHRHR